jgi:hypothetical protein
MQPLGFGIQGSPQGRSKTDGVGNREAVPESIFFGGCRRKVCEQLGMQVTPQFLIDWRGLRPLCSGDAFAPKNLLSHSFTEAVKNFDLGGEVHGLKIEKLFEGDLHGFGDSFQAADRRCIDATLDESDEIFRVTRCLGELCLRQLCLLAELCDAFAKFSFDSHDGV